MRRLGELDPPARRGPDRVVLGLAMAFLAVAALLVLIALPARLAR